MAETWDRPTLEDRVNEQRAIDTMLVEWIVKYGGRPLNAAEYAQIEPSEGWPMRDGWVRRERAAVAVLSYHIAERGLNRLEEMKNERPND